MSCNLRQYLSGIIYYTFSQGKPILICGKSDNEVEKKSHYVLKVPEIVDCLQGILTVIPLQLLSFHIAVLKGCNVSSRVSAV